MLQHKNKLSLLLLISIIILLFGMYLYGNGYHSSDMGHNMKWIESEYGIALEDKTLQNEIISGNRAYSLGHWQIRISILFFIVGAFLFGICFTELINNYQVQKK